MNDRWPWLRTTAESTAPVKLFDTTCGASTAIFSLRHSRIANTWSMKMFISENLWTLIFALIVAVGLPTIILAVTLIAN